MQHESPSMLHRLWNDISFVNKQLCADALPISCGSPEISVDPDVRAARTPSPTKISKSPKRPERLNAAKTLWHELCLLHSVNQKEMKDAK